MQLLRTQHRLTHTIFTKLNVKNIEQVPAGNALFSVTLIS